MPRGRPVALPDTDSERDIAARKNEHRDVWGEPTPEEYKDEDQDEDNDDSDDEEKDEVETETKSAPKRRGRPPKLKPPMVPAVTPLSPSNGITGDAAEPTSSGPAPGQNGHGNPQQNVPSEDVGISRVLNAWIEKLKNDEESYVTAWRVKPEYIDGKEASGVSGRWTVAALRNADDLLADLEQKSGGSLYDLRFCGKNSAGRLMQLKQVRVPINATPILRSGTGKDKPAPSNVMSPDVDLTKGTFEVMRSLITEMKDSQPRARDQAELMKTIKDIVQQQGNGAIDGYKQTIDFMRDELKSLRENLGGAKSASSETNAQIQKETQKEFNRERERWESERGKLVTDQERERLAWQAERSKLLSDHERERSQLNDRLSQHIDKLTEKLEAAQGKLKEREESFAKERLDRERATDDRARFRDEMHARDIQGIRDQWASETKALREQWASEVKRLAEQVSDERRGTEKLKEMYELAKKAELDKQEGIFREQLEGNKNRISLLEERIRDLEKQKEKLQSDILTAQTSRPDPLGAVKDTLGAVGSIANVMGWKPNDTSAPTSEMRTEFGQLAKDLKDAGVVDAAKGVVERIATAVSRQPQQQPQQQQVQQMPFMQMPYMPYMPPGAFPVQPQFVQPQQFVPQPQPVQQFVPQSIPQPQPASVSAPIPVPAPAQSSPPPSVTESEPPMGELEAAAWKQVVKGLEISNEAKRLVPEVAKQLLDEVPMSILRDIVEAGVESFQAMVAKVCMMRPEEPDSVLLSPRGESWLRDLLEELRKGIS